MTVAGRLGRMPVRSGGGGSAPDGGAEAAPSARALGPTVGLFGGTADQVGRWKQRRRSFCGSSTDYTSVTWHP